MVLYSVVSIRDVIICNYLGFVWSVMNIPLIDFCAWYLFHGSWILRARRRYIFLCAKALFFTFWLLMLLNGYIMAKSSFFLVDLRHSCLCSFSLSLSLSIYLSFWLIGLFMVFPWQIYSRIRRYPFMSCLFSVINT